MVLESPKLTKKVSESSLSYSQCLLSGSSVLIFLFFGYPYVALVSCIVNILTIISTINIYNNNGVPHPGCIPTGLPSTYWSGGKEVRKGGSTYCGIERGCRGEAVVDVVGRQQLSL